MLTWITALSGLPGQIGAALRMALVRTALTLCGATLLLAAAAFSAAALYDWLSTRMASHLASLSVAAVLTVLAATFLLAARLYRRRGDGRSTWPPSGAPPPETVLAEIERSPSASVLAAVALGVIVGLLRSGRTR